MQRARGKGKEAKGKRQKARAKAQRTRGKEKKSRGKFGGEFDNQIGFLSQQIYYHEAFTIN